MILIFGLKDIFLKRSYALRMEILFLIFLFIRIPITRQVYEETASEENRAFLIDFMEIIILMRLLRIFEFLNELE